MCWINNSFFCSCVRAAVSFTNDRMSARDQQNGVCCIQQPECNTTPSHETHIHQDKYSLTNSMETDFEQDRTNLQRRSQANQTSS